MYDLENLEKDRLSIVRKLKSSIFFVALISIAVLIIIYKQTYDFTISIFVAGFCAISLYGIFKSNLTKNFNAKFKNQVVKTTISNINKNLVYEPNLYMSFSDFNRSGIYKYPDTYSGNDLIYGEIDGVDVKFSDVFLKEKIEFVDNRGFVHTEYRNIFSGIFFMADFHKNFSSQTYVLGNKFGYKFGNRAYMDDSKFEKVFKTYTNDQINARYILTPKLMEQILKTKELFNCPLNIAFLDYQIYIYMELNKDSFEPDIFYSLIGENSLVLRYRNEISNLINLVKELNLNSKIWG